MYHKFDFMKTLAQQEPLYDDFTAVVSRTWSDWSVISMHLILQFRIRDGSFH
jgi:hypothetical protein